MLCTYGQGWYQQWGQPPQALKVRDVVVVPPNVKHWHGAQKDSWFIHLAVEVPGKNTQNKWLEPVDDEAYNQLK